MKTILRGRTTEVVIDTGGPVVIIGESINPTRRRKLVSTLQEGSFDYLLELADIQIKAGAEVLDVNVGFPGVDDQKLLPEVVSVLQGNFDIPLCLDSPNPSAIEAALKVAAGRCLINSVSGSEESLKTLIPIAKEYDAAIIGLCMDETGIPDDPEKRLAVAERIIERAVRSGIDREDVVVDPLAMAVSAEPQACIITLGTISLISRKLGCNITVGTSNISFGLPGRESLNSAFVSMAIAAGLTCPIANPEKIASAVKASDLIMGRDDYAIRFVGYFQGIQ